MISAVGPRLLEAIARARRSGNLSNATAREIARIFIPDAARRGRKRASAEKDATSFLAIRVDSRSFAEAIKRWGAAANVSPRAARLRIARARAELRADALTVDMDWDVDERGRPVLVAMDAPGAALASILLEAVQDDK